MTIRWWQIPAALACLGLNLVFAWANLSFMTRQAEAGRVDVYLFAVIAVVIELGLIAAPFAMARWRGERRWLRLMAATLVWLVCIGFSAHSLNGWLRTNFAAGEAVANQGAESKEQIRIDLDAARDHLREVDAKLVEKMTDARREALGVERTRTHARVEMLKGKLGEVRIEARAAPVSGYDAAATLALVIVNSVVWFAFFGDGAQPVHDAQRTRTAQSARAHVHTAVRDARAESADAQPVHAAQPVCAERTDGVQSAQSLISQEELGEVSDLGSARERRDARIAELDAQGCAPEEIARDVRVHRTTVVRVLKRVRAQAAAE